MFYLIKTEFYWWLIDCKWICFESKASVNQDSQKWHSEWDCIETSSVFKHPSKLNVECVTTVCSEKKEREIEFQFRANIYILFSMHQMELTQNEYDI